MNLHMKNLKEPSSVPELIINNSLQGTTRTTNIESHSPTEKRPMTILKEPSAFMTKMMLKNEKDLPMCLA